MDAEHSGRDEAENRPGDGSGAENAWDAERMAEAPAEGRLAGEGAERVAPPPVYEPPEPPPVFVPGRTAAALAGLESGVNGALLMVGWFLLESWAERQYWWAMLNLWGAGVYQDRVLTMGLGMATLAGGATHVFLHGLAGVAWSLAGIRIGNRWWYLAGAFLTAGLLYLLLMEGFWPAVAPVVERLSPRPATAMAYLLFGAALSRSADRARELSGIWKT